MVAFPLINPSLSVNIKSLSSAALLKPLCEHSSVTIGDVVKCCASTVDTAGALIGKWSAKEIGVGESSAIECRIKIYPGSGYMSLVIRVTLNWLPPDTGLPTSVVVKAPSLHKLRAMTDSENDAANVPPELVIFTDFGRVMRNYWHKVP